MQQVVSKLCVHKRIYLIFLFPLGYAISIFSENNPHITEWYSLNIYIPLSGVFSAVSGVFPFSLLEFGILLFLPCFIIHLIYNIFSKKWQSKGEGIISSLSTFIAFSSCLYIIFVLMCGVNYNRMPFSHYLGVEVRPSSTEDLYSLCLSLISETNSLAEEVPRNAEGIAEYDFASNSELAKACFESFDLTAQNYYALDGSEIKAKAVLTSPIMSYTEITGVFSPFTIEANYNSHIPSFTIPTTINHEMAHVRGFMREDEANFIAYLTTANSDDPRLAYSGNMLALIHSMNALYSDDYELFLSARSLYNDELNADLNYRAQYWDNYEGAVAEAVEAVNNSYLIANNQADGVKSYGRMVDLLLAHQRGLAED